MHESHACQRADFGADRTFGQPGLLDDLIQWKWNRGDVQHCKDRAHALGKPPKTANLTETFCEILLELSEFSGHDTIL